MLVYTPPSPGGQGVCLPGGVPGGVFPSACWDTPPTVESMTDACENNTYVAEDNNAYELKTHARMIAGSQTQTVLQRFTVLTVFSQPIFRFTRTGKCVPIRLTIRKINELMKLSGGKNHKKFPSLSVNAP